MLEKQGNLLEAAPAPNTWAVFTANSVVTHMGRLVMGAGIAKLVRDAYPGIDAYLGMVLKANGMAGGRFHTIVDRSRRVIALQTKIDWKDPSPLDLVVASCYQLGQFAYLYPKETFVMTRPGCGHGGLTWDQVKPHISPLLPDNVHVYHLEKSHVSQHHQARRNHASLGSQGQPA